MERLDAWIILLQTETHFYDTTVTLKLTKLTGCCSIIQMISSLINVLPDVEFSNYMHVRIFSHYFAVKRMTKLSNVIPVV